MQSDKYPRSECVRISLNRSFCVLDLFTPRDIVSSTPLKPSQINTVSTNEGAYVSLVRFNKKLDQVMYGFWDSNATRAPSEVDRDFNGKVADIVDVDPFAVDGLRDSLPTTKSLDLLCSGTNEFSLVLPVSLFLCACLIAVVINTRNIYFSHFCFIRPRPRV